MLRLACVTAVICGLGLVALMAPAPAQAHQDGCHAQHSCPSDTGSYVCGDTGNYSECPGLAAYALPTVATANFVSPDVGSIVNCSAGNWSAAVTSRSYQWVRNGADAEGQTTASYLLTPADISVAVSCRVTVTDGRGQTATSTSNPITLAPPPALTALSLPTIDTGGPPARNGSLLVCSATKWSVSTTAVAYQWLRDGAPIAGATTDSYRVTVADLGRRISCQQAAKGSRGQDGSATSPAVAAKASPRLTLRKLGDRNRALPCGATLQKACATRRGSVVRFGGAATAPVLLVGKVQVAFQRQVRGRWVTRQTSRVAIDDFGAFFARYKVPRLATGAFRVRATLDASPLARGAKAPDRFVFVGPER